MTTIDIVVLPRERMQLNWEEFLEEYPAGSIALDGSVKGGPNSNPETSHDNFDHHENVVREATMSTCKQVLYAIKGNMMKYKTQLISPVPVIVNDPDQDVCMSCWELENYKLLEGTQSIPHIGRLIELTDRLDVTGGAFPMNLRSELLQHHNWIFEPYNELRKSGSLAQGSPEVIKDCIESVMGRINKFMMGEGGKKPLDTRYEIICTSPFGYKFVDEIGGNEARYKLFSEGMDSFVSIVAERPDKRRVISIGRRSKFVPFPVNELYPILSEAEGLSLEEGWGGSDIVGGSSRAHGTSLSNEEIVNIIDTYLTQKYG